MTLSEETRTTIEVQFGKKWEARLLSHLDVMRALSRALRRTGLPIYFTEGFNPKPKVSYLTQPLAVGHTSECERFRFMLEEEKSVEETLRALAAKMPPGLEPTAARYVREGEKPAVPTAMEYILFLRKGARGDAPQPPFSMPEEFGWMSPREAAPSEIAAARLFDSRETTAPRRHGRGFYQRELRVGLCYQDRRRLGVPTSGQDNHPRAPGRERGLLFPQAQGDCGIGEKFLRAAGTNCRISFDNIKETTARRGVSPAPRPQGRPLWRATGPNANSTIRWTMQ